MNYAVMVLCLAVALGAPIWAQERAGEGGGVDLSKYRCAEYLEVVDARDGRAQTFQAWAHGYNSALRGLGKKKPPTVTWEIVDKFVLQLEEICFDAPEKLFIEAVKQVK